MDTKLRSFRKRAREENRGRTGTSLRYSRELRLEAVLYLKRRQSEGGTLDVVASELGVSGWSLSRWMQDSGRRVAVVPVEVTEHEESRTATLVTPRGYRIEGLSAESLVRLVERLG